VHASYDGDRLAVKEITPRATLRHFDTTFIIVPGRLCHIE